jgi:hypothetical protein
VSEQEREVTNEEIAQRAYEISQSAEAGSDDDNWLRAERELRGGNRDGEEPDGPLAKTSSGDMDSVTSDS